MFTGIIENTGTVQKVETEGSNKIFWISSPLSSELKVDQSVSHDGVCLTIEEVDSFTHKITAIEETLQKTTLNSWITGSEVNLEQSVRVNDRLDGHIVQGHVDTIAICILLQNKNGSFEFSFEVESQFAPLMIEKGSIALNGISLTIFGVTKNTFKVGIIPYTLNHTNLQHIKPGDKVNIEFDMIGKYISRISALKNNTYL